MNYIWVQIYDLMIKNKMDDSEKLAALIVEGMQEKKAKQITLLDLRKLNTNFADFFVVCHGNSDRQVEAIADSVEDHVRKNVQEKPYHTEGKDLCNWVLMDYIHVVVHVFTEEKRNFYGVEELWGDAQITKYPDIE